MYIDAFAGSGEIMLRSSGDTATSARLPGLKADTEDVREVQGFIRGSAQRAIGIDDKPFDKLIFVEKDPNRCAELGTLRREHPERNIVVENCEANKFLSNLNGDWSKWRGVLFLDPFGTEVEWSTIEKIASFEALDTWILFPLRAIGRMLPVSRRPEEIDPSWVKRLNKVYGDESWRSLYRESSQTNLFGDPKYGREPGIEGLLNIYKNKLAGLFGDRFLDKTKTLKNSKNSPLYEFMFCVGNPNGIKLATKIAGYILRKKAALGK